MNADNATVASLAVERPFWTERTASTDLGYGVVVYSDLTRGFESYVGTENIASTDLAYRTVIYPRILRGFEPRFWTERIEGTNLGYGHVAYSGLGPGVEPSFWPENTASTSSADTGIDAMVYSSNTSVELFQLKYVPCENSTEPLRRQLLAYSTVLECHLPILVRSVDFTNYASSALTTRALQPLIDNPGVVAEAQAVREVTALFAAAEDLQLENGMESPLSRGLVAIVREFGRLAVEAVNQLLDSGQFNDEVAWEAVRWMGRMIDPPTYRERMAFLERTLQSPRPRLRDSAALALASMDDPHAIPYLRRAIEREACTELRGDMATVLAQLQTA